MNRTKIFEFNGKKHPLCFTLGALEESDEISKSKVSPRLKGIKMLASMMKYGARRAEIMGEEAPEPLTEEDLLALFTIADYEKADKLVAEVIELSYENEVKGKPTGKKQKA